MEGALATSNKISMIVIMCLALAWVSRLPAFGQSQPASTPDSDAPVFVIVHIDVFPQGTGETVKALQAFAWHARADKRCIRFQVLQQTGRPNHFTLVEEWANQAAYDADLSSPEAREFREKLQPFLGSPFDERLHTEIR